MKAESDNDGIADTSSLLGKSHEEVMWMEETMSEQERENPPSEPAPEVWDVEYEPKPEEVLSEKLSEMAEAATADLKDLHESLVPADPVIETAVEQLAEAEAVAEPVAEAAGDQLAELNEVVVEAAAPAVAATTPEPGATLPGDAAWKMPKPAAEVAESTGDDRLVSALAWLSMVILQLPIVSIIQLLSATNRERPFQRHHAVTSLLFYAGGIVYETVAGIVYVILGLLTLGIGFACLWVIFFVPHLFGLYYALQAYNGKRVELPILSSFGRNQGWM